jgi:hypothetical protein
LTKITSSQPSPSASKISTPSLDTTGPGTPPTTSLNCCALLVRVANNPIANKNKIRRVRIFIMIETLAADVCRTETSPNARRSAKKGLFNANGEPSRRGDDLSVITPDSGACDRFILA